MSFRAMACLLILALPPWLPAQSPVKGTREELEAAYKKAMDLYRAGKYADAVPLLEKASQIGHALFGPDDKNTSDLLNTLGAAYHRAGQHDKAIPAFKQSLRIREALVGKEHVWVSESLSNLAGALWKLGRLKEAQDLYQRSLEIVEKKLGKDSADAATVANNLALVYKALGQLEDAESLYLRSVHARESLLGKDHPDVAKVLVNLGGLYQAMGRFADADTACRRGFDILRRKFGEESFHLEVPLNSLGRICQASGRYVEAETHLLRSLRLREARLPKDHIEVAVALHNLALLYSETGRFGDAENLYRRSLAIHEARLDKDHTETATVRANLGTLYHRLARHKEAEALYRACLASREARLGHDHPLVAYALGNLASLLSDLNRFDDAEAMLSRALKIGETSLGEQHPQVGAWLNSLAVLYKQTRRYDDAEATYARSLKIGERHLGPDHPHVVATLNNLGLLYTFMGRYKEATAHIERALDSAAKQKPPSDNIAHIYDALAALHALKGDTDQALKLQDKSLQVSQEVIQRVFSFSSEAAMFSFLATTDADLPSMITVALKATAEQGPRTALDWALRRKGILFNSLSEYRRLHEHLTPDDPLSQRIAEYRGLKRLLADAALTRADTDEAEQQKRLAHWRKQLIELEAEIHLGLSKRADSKSVDSIDSGRVQKRLAADTALVEIVRCRLILHKEQAWSPPRYFAFILLPGAAPPQLIDLGAAKPIDTGVAAVRKLFDDFQEKLKDCESDDEIKALEKAQEKEFQKAGHDLHDLVFAPLRKALGKTSLIYLAADGDLNRLPFESLTDDKGKYLIESYQFAYLSSGRDLLRPDTKPAKGTVVFANPDFRAAPEERKEHAAKLLDGKKADRLLVASRGIAETRSVGWKALPGAAAEARDIEKLLDGGAYGPVATYQGKEALEEAFKTMTAPRVLHLATHGFFVDHDPDAVWKEGEGAGWARGRLKAMDNPLLRSGIVLAGANTVGEKDKTVKVEDGWVTAEEIALLNLRGTELVVLSACQTGLGDVRSGEGVSGLRWAFLYAGARTLVTSLFEVPDAETRDLMKHFYSRLKSEGKLAALHGAQRALIEERRSRHGAAHPFFWASFVLVGDPK